MEAKHIQDIMEAYASLYAQPEQEVLFEEVEQLDEARITRPMGRRATEYRRKQEQDAHMERVRQHQHNMENNPEYRERHERLRQTHSRRNNGGEGGEDQKESFDLFDYLLEYLVAEGYADTNKAALAIMANMSEEWKQSICEELLNEVGTNLYRPDKPKPTTTIFQGAGTPASKKVNTVSPEGSHAQKLKDA